MSEATVGTEPPALAVLGISKAFPGTQALDDVSFSVNRASIHALLGGNGSGKSTLVKILSGFYSADEGEIGVHGERYDARNLSFSQMRQAGFRFVHQLPSHFLEMTVAENLMIGSEFTTGVFGRIRWREAYKRARAVLEEFHVDAKPRQQLSTVGPATKTMVEIARALHDKEEARDRILVLDEPTASLPPAEVEVLTAALRYYADQGQTIVLVTHRLEEVQEVADAATVIRDGKLVDTLPKSEINHDRLVKAIVGRAIERLYPDSVSETSGETVLKVRDLRLPPVKNLSFEVNKGEIVGIAGLVGSGRSEALKAIYGAMDREAGDVSVLGRPLRARDTAASVAAGVGLVAEDRTETAFANMSVRDNLSAAVVSRYFRRGIFRHRRERRDADELKHAYKIRVRSSADRFTTMSGGNQQKTILARWLRLNPTVLLLDEPTQGVDIGARADIYQFIQDAADSGTAVVLVSSDFGELAHLAHRVIILVNGEGVGELEGEMTAELIEDHVYASVASEEK